MRLVLTFYLAIMVTLLGVVVPVASAQAAWLPADPNEVVSRSFPGHTFDPDALEATSVIVVDIRTGALLFEKGPDESYGPASLSKIVTLALTYRAIDEGRAAPDDLVLVSERAWATNPENPHLHRSSLMWIEVGEEIPLETLMTGMIVASGNDACIAVAEHLAGSEEAFVGRMNDMVRELGMRETYLGTVHGLPAEGQKITPRDVARLVRFFTTTYPQAENITSQESFTYAGITTRNYNGLVLRDERITGLKTGYTRESGYHLVATARDGDEHYAAIVMGIGAGVEDQSESEAVATREREALALLNWAFDNFTQHTVDVGPALPEEVRVYGGQPTSIAVRVGEDPIVTLPTGTEDQIRVEVSLGEAARAPLSRDDVIGTLNLYWEPSDDGEPVHLGLWTVHPAEELERGSWWRRMIDSILLFFQRLRGDG